MRRILAAMTVFIILTGNAGADQLAYLTRSQAEKAVTFLKEQKTVLLFCGCCSNDRKVIVDVKDVYMAHAGYEDYYEVFIEGFNGENQIKQAIDLAYVFINKEGIASAVGVELDMECDPCVENMQWGIR